MFSRWTISLSLCLLFLLRSFFFARGVRSLVLLLLASSCFCFGAFFLRSSFFLGFLVFRVLDPVLKNRPLSLFALLALDRETFATTQFRHDAQRSSFQNVVDFFFLGSYSNQGTFLFLLLNAFVCLRVRVFRERERDLFFLRAQFLRVVASPPSFSL